MRKIISILLVALLSLILITGCAPKKIIMRLAETHPADYPTTLGDMEFARLVNERTNGRITIEVYHSKQLGEEKAAIEQVQLGAIDFTRVSLSPVSAFVKKLDALQLPYLYRDADHMWKVLNGPIGEEMLKAVEEANFVGLCWYDPGSRNFYNSKREIRTAADLKGLKIRVQQSDLMIKMVKLLGANPTPLPYGEVYSALKTGVIDGAENNFPSYDSQSHYEVAKYFTVDEHTRVPEILLASKIVMDKLPKKDQEIIKQAAKDSVPLQIKLWNEKEKASEEKVKKAGCKIYYPTPEEKKTFMDAMKPLYDEQPPEIQEIIKRIQEVK